MPEAARSQQPKPLTAVRTCCGVREERCRKKGEFLKTMSRPLRLQSSPVRVLSRTFLPDGQSDIAFYHKFFDTFCWAECRRCAFSNKRTVGVQGKNEGISLPKVTRKPF